MTNINNFVYSILVLIILKTHELEICSILLYLLQQLCQLELSPTTQTKIEDLWNTENSNKRPRSLGTNHASEEGDNMLDSIPVKGTRH